MEIRIKNLGAVKSADITLKKLTVFVGENNSGKTWVATTICGLLDQRAFQSILTTLKNQPENLVHSFDDIIELPNRLVKEKVVSINLNDFFLKYKDNYFDNISQLSRKWMKPIIGTDQKIFDDFQISLHPLASKEIIEQIVNDLQIDDTYQAGTNLPPIRLKKEREKPELLITLLESKTDIQLPFDIIKNYIYHSVISLLHQLSSIGIIHYLPAERTGIMTFLDLLNPIPDLSEEKRRPKKIVSPLSIAVNSMFSELRLLQRMDIAKSLIIKHNRDERGNEYETLATILEKEILGGKITYLENPELNTQSLRYHYDSNPERSLEMSAASSTVKDMVPLVLYLRYYLTKEDMLFIDEPEMNLHPENQARFMEFLTLLVNSGIKVLMVTHSPYMVNHLESLVLAEKNKDKDSIQNNFYLKNKDAFIKQDDVSVYLFEDGVAKNILSDEGIDLSTYDSVTEKITDIYTEV